MDLNKYKAAMPQAILKLRETEPVTPSKVPGWSTIHGVLSDGNECFVSLPDAALEKVPEKEGYVNLTGLVAIKKNKFGKLYMERLVEMPAKDSNFKSPF